MRSRKLIYILISFIILCTAFTACRKEKDIKDDVSIEVTPTPTITPTIPPEDTFEGLTPIVPSIQDEDPNSDTEATYLSEKEAVAIIQKEIGDRGYFLELLDDHLNIGAESYFIYQISDGTSAIDPNVLVNKVSGELLCYYSDGSTAPFTEFPLYTAPESDKASQDLKKFTIEDAHAKLGKFSAKTLGLPEKLKKYTIVYDEWTTNVNGVECYGINAFSDLGDKMTNMGTFYVAVDGSKMFKFDSMLDDFVELVED